LFSKWLQQDSLETAPFAPTAVNARHSRGCCAAAETRLM
jgi:hypothetical protein